MDYPLTAILSDLHGNTPALEVALDDARARGVRRFVCLGDVVGYGAQPRACLDLVMALCVPDARDPQNGQQPTSPNDGSPNDGPPNDGQLQDGLCLLGNHEQALLYNAEDFNPKARAAIDWTREELGRDSQRTEAYWDFIGDLQPSCSDELAMFAHGSPRDPVREYLLPRDVRNEEKLADNFAHMNRPVCFVGHSHVPAVYYEDGRLFIPSGTEGPFDLGDVTTHRCIVNVGSVGQPRDGDNRLSYVVFDGRRITFVRLEYPWRDAAQQIRDVPELPDFLADRLAVGK